jgi:hypothetical protein
MNPQPARQYTVQVEEGPGHGDLYELEKTIYHHIVDASTQEIVMTFEGGMSASLSRSTGQWEDYQYGGVREVAIAPDTPVAVVRYYSGQEETVPLPQ